MFIERNSRRNRAYTLVEFMMASALGLLAAAAIAQVYVFSARSFAAMGNYADMAMYSRLALDKMSRAIHQNCKVTAYSTNSISLQNQSGNVTTYTWNSGTGQLLCYSGGTTSIYLIQCSSLQFWLYQHTLQSNRLDCFTPATSVTNARVVQMTWSCSRQMFATKMTTEAMESGKIALRNY